MCSGGVLAQFRGDLGDAVQLLRLEDGEEDKRSTAQVARCFERVLEVILMPFGAGPNALLARREEILIVRGGLAHDEKGAIGAWLPPKIVAVSFELLLARFA